MPDGPADPTQLHGERLSIVDAMVNPLGGRVLAALCERPDVTIRQVAVRLDEPVRRIRHQVDRLVSSGLVEITGVDHRRGAIERRYGRSRPVVVVDDDGLSGDQRLQMATGIIRLLLENVTIAARAGTFGSPSRSNESRYYGEVDDECLRQIAEIQMRAHKEMEEAMAVGKERVRGGGGSGIEVVAALFLFEAPLWASAVEADGRQAG